MLALRVNDHAHAGIVASRLGDLLHREPLMRRAPPLPQDYLRVAQHLVVFDATEVEPLIPNGYLLLRDTQRQRRVASQVFVGEEQHTPPARERSAGVALGVRDVQTMPPLRPQNAFRFAAEFIYVTGITACNPSSVGSSR